MAKITDFAEACVCGGSRGRCNPDCERCNLIQALMDVQTELAEARRRLETLEKGAAWHRRWIDYYDSRLRAAYAVASSDATAIARIAAEKAEFAARHPAILAPPADAGAAGDGGG